MRARCSELLVQTENCNIIFGIMLIRLLTSLVNPLVLVLQTKGLSHHEGTMSMRKTIAMVKKYSFNREKCNEITDQARKLCLDVGGTLKLNRGLLVEGVSPSEIWFKIYSQCLSKFATDLEHRSDEAAEKAGVIAYLPEYMNSSNEIMISARQYKDFIDEKQLKVELEYLSDESILELNLHDLEKMSKVQYPNVNILAKIGLAMPSSNAPPERIFSVLNRLETTLRTKMNQQRISMLALIETNRDYIPELDEVMAEFAKKDRKINLFK